jgi:hypothetical protein
MNDSQENVLSPSAGANELFTWHRISGTARLASAMCAGGCTAVLGVSRFLTPDPRGFGTHEQLGMLPCASMKLFNIPCPFCGMTTSFSLMAHGNFEAAFWNQPAALMLFLGTVLAIPISAYMSASGWSLDVPTKWKVQRLWLVPAAAILGAAWIYKILALVVH